MKNVSLGARKLLKLFQWFWRNRGPDGCFPKSFYLMARFEVCLRTVRRWIKELRMAGFLSVILRGRRGAVYLEEIPIEIPTQQAFDFKQDVTNSVTNSVTNCRGSSITEVEEPETSLQAVEELIAEYPHAKHLPGRPGLVIAQRCLDLARGDVDALVVAIRALWLASRKPGYSWGWFPAVIGQYAGGRRRA